MPYPWSAGNVLTATDLNSAFAAKTDLAMVQNAQTGSSYSYALADASKLLTMSNAASNTVTVTKQATVTWVTGTQLRVLNLGAGVTTLVADTGVTINNNKALAQYQGGTLIRTASDVWTFVPNSASGKVLQVISTTKLDAFTTSSTSLVDVTGLSVSITPTSATSTVLVSVSMSLHNSTSGAVSAGNLLRGTTAIGGGTAVGSRGSANVRMRIQSNGDSFSPIAFMFLDSPASASTQTYKMQVRAEVGNVTVGYAAGADSDNNQYPRFASTITVMEISA